MKSLLVVAMQFLILAALPGQKKILVEKFTNAFCGQCPGGTELLKELEKENAELIWVLHHKPVDWIDNELNNDDSAVLWNDLNKPGNPTAMVNRVPVGNRLTSSMGKWRAEIERQKIQPYYAQLGVTGVEYNKETRVLDFDVEITFDELPETERYAISAMIIEDKVGTMQQHSYFNNVAGHPLEGRGDIIWDYEHRNAVRAILNAPWGTNQLIPPSPQVGETYSGHYSYTIPESYEAQNIKIVAFVSSQDNDDVLNREIYNSAKVELKDYGFQLSQSQELIEEQVSVFPNPSKDLLRLEFTRVPSSIEIVDMQGQIVFSKNSQIERLTTIDVSSFISGSYILLSHFEDKTFARKLQIIP